jgi:hypothetical protein
VTYLKTDLPLSEPSAGTPMPPADKQGAARVRALLPALICGILTLAV